jgi:hypothetical protein
MAHQKDYPDWQSQASFLLLPFLGKLAHASYGLMCECEVSSRRTVSLKHATITLVA